MRKLHSTDSTNLYIRRHIGKGDPLPDMFIVYADEQTAGRGQKGNSWESEAGKNIIFSLLCHPSFVSPAHQFILSQCIALAIAETLGEYTDDITVKWPNDIYWKNKKISGTLIECDLQGSRISNCIIGSGININQTVFLSDAPNPVSLKMITGKDYDTLSVLQQVIDRFQHYYSLAREGKDTTIAETYMRNLYRRNCFHKYEDTTGVFTAQIHSIEPSGHLVLQTPDGTLRRYEFKEVKFLP